MRHRVLSLSLCALLAFPFSRALGDAYDPPVNYYSTATGTGATLKSQLNSIIDGHTDIGYDAVRTALQVTDADVAHPGHMFTVYDRTSLNVAAINPNGNPPGWDNAATWNREHTWPRSRGIDSSGPDDSDLFNLRPALTADNGARQNFNFGGAFGSPMGLVTAPSPDQWYPGNADTGMIARQQFYMAVRYDGADSSTANLELAAGNPSASMSTALLGDKDRMIEWHFAAPPDTFERRRNQVIYDQYQHNRNPFTDRPELAWSVFVDQANDSRIVLNGGITDADGASTLNVDLGRRLVGAVLPSAQSVTLSNAGTDGTYYQVTPAGAATSSLTGRHNALRTNVNDSKSFSVGLSTSTAVAGLKSGSVTIDNLDVTTSGGSGRGDNDDNDVVNVSLSVLDHANASFVAGLDVNSLTLDFGTVAQGSTATLPFSLFNLAATAGFTAGLDFDSIAGSGQTSVLTTDLAPFSGASTLAAASTRSFVATLNTAAIGSFSASYSLEFSDENLPGATALGGLTLTLTGAVTEPADDSADFDQNSVVNGIDFLAWQQGFGMTGASRIDGDANHSTTVDDADLAIWQNQFGLNPPEVAPAPEPAAECLALAAAMAALSYRRQTSNR